MPDISIVFFFAVSWLLAGFVRGICGMGGSIIAVSILSLTTLPFTELIPATVITAALVTVYGAWVYRKGLNKKILFYLVLGSIPGGILGVYFLKTIPSHILKICLGALLLFYVIWQLRNRIIPPHRDMPFAAFNAGAASGLIAGSTSLGGPPIAMYALYAGWGHNEAVSTMGLYFFFSNIVIIATQATAGLITSSVLIDVLASLPAGAIGIQLSRLVTNRLPLSFFRRLLQFVLLLAALSCLYNGSKALF